MLRSSCVLLVLVLLAPRAGANGPSDTELSGLWVGHCHVGGTQRMIVRRFGRRDGAKKQDNQTYAA